MILYVAEADGLGRVKIGRSDMPNERVRGMQNFCPVPLRMVGVALNAGTEREVHAWFADERLHGEWFIYSDRIRAWVATLEVLSDVEVIRRLTDYVPRYLARDWRGKRAA